MVPEIDGYRFLDMIVDDMIYHPLFIFHDEDEDEVKPHQCRHSLGRRRWLIANSLLRGRRTFHLSVEVDTYLYSTSEATGGGTIHDEVERNRRHTAKYAAIHL
jgi:hypothetical protein